VVKGYNRNHISLNSHTGHVGGFGKNEIEYEAEFQTMGEFNHAPPMGFAYGFAPPAEMSIPMAVPVGTAFTAVPTATPVWQPLPMAQAFVMPSVISTTTTTTTTTTAVAPGGAAPLPMTYATAIVDDGAVPVMDVEPRADLDDGDLTDGDDDDDDAPESESESEYDDDAAAEAAHAKKASPPMTSSLISQLQRLAELHRTGVLSDVEFEVAKAKTLHPQQHQHV